MRNLFLVYEIAGETQCVERILIKFSEKYKEDNPEKNITADIAFTLTFAFMMLNTDQHNKDVDNKMKLADFLKTVRYVADNTVISDEKV